MHIGWRERSETSFQELLHMAAAVDLSKNEIPMRKQFTGLEEDYERLCSRQDKSNRSA
jgi:hypothetical protein